MQFIPWGCSLVLLIGHAATAEYLPNGAGCSLNFRGNSKVKVEQQKRLPGEPNFFDFSQRDFSVLAWLKAPYMWTTNKEQVMASYPVNSGWRWGILSKAGGNDCFPKTCPYGTIYGRLVYLAGTGSENPACTATIPDGEWHHWAFVLKNRSTVRFYLDGNLVCDRYFELGAQCNEGGRSVACNVYNDTKLNDWKDSFFLGENPNWGYPYGGEMDDFQYWSRGLSTEDVRSVMRRPPAANDPDLFVHYTFDECSGTVAIDATGKWNGTFGKKFKENPTYSTSPIFSDSGAHIFGDSLAGLRVSSSLTSGVYSSVSWSVLDGTGVIVNASSAGAAGLVAYVTRLESDNAVLELRGQPLKVNSTWPLGELVQPKVLDASRAYKLLGDTVGWQKALAGHVSLEYQVQNASGGILVSFASLKVSLEHNRQPIIGDGGYALRFDGRDDYVGSVDFVLKHRTWTNDSSIFGRADKGGTFGGRSGRGHSSSVTVELWLKQTTEFLSMKEFIRGKSLDGQSLLTIGNGDTNATTTPTCFWEQPERYCYGRFNAHLPWSKDWPYGYFDYGWMSMSGPGRIFWNAEPLIDSWIHLAFVANLDDETMTVYANGQAIVSGPADGAVADLTGIFLGGWPGINSFHRGDMDDFRVYNRSKTEFEVREGMFRPADISDPDLLGYWNLDDCAKDDEVSENCRDLSRYRRPLTAANCGQAYDGIVNPGWGHQSGAGAYGDPSQQVRTCKRFDKPAASDKESWPQGVVSGAPIASSTTPLGPRSMAEEVSGQFSRALSAVDPDPGDSLKLEIVRIDAPGVQLAVGNETIVAGSVIAMTRDAAYPIVHRAAIDVRLPQQHGSSVGSIVLRARDQHGRASASETVQMLGFVCGPGKEYNSQGLGNSLCLPCKPGSFSVGQGGACRRCEAGSYAANSGSTACELAPPGYMVQDKGTSQPIRCPPGFIAPVSGAAQCKPCDFGLYQGEAGQSECAACRMMDSRTVSQGATSPSECVCGEGSFEPLSGGRCLPCPFGIRCEVGSSLASGSARPQVVAGHYVEFKNASGGAVMSVYRCKPAEACPGGALAEEQHCADRRSGFLCTQCPTGTYPSEGGCKDCGGGSYAVIVILALLLLAVIMLVTVLGGRMHPAAAGTNASAGLKALTLALMFFQTVGAIYNIGIVWDDPFKSVCEAMSFLNFDVDIINIGCAQFGGPLNIYVLKMVLPMVGVAVMIATWFALRVLSIGNLSFDGVLNGVGSVLTIFYITQTVAAFSPYSCYPHPNGKLSMTLAPEVMCHSGSEHASMVGVSIVGIIAYPVTIFAVTAYAVLRYPYAIVGCNLRFVTRFGFIFHRWTPDRYWFGSVILVRNFLVAVLPILISKSEYKLAILLVEFVLLMMACLLLVFKPWKLSILTSCDAGLNLALLMLLAVGAVEQVSTAYSIACVVLFASSAISTGFLLCWYALHYIRGPTYDVFLSHHKKNGACCARLLKLHLSTKFSGGVFLDCDNLMFLGTLFDQVKQSKIVVVILSGATLSRPWCLGEIAQAVLSSIKLFPVTFLTSTNGSISLGNDATPKTEQEISQLDGIATLYPFGISASAIQRGIAELLNRVPWRIPLDSSSGLQNDVRGMCDEMSALVGTVRRLPFQLNSVLSVKVRRSMSATDQGDLPAHDAVNPKTLLLTNRDSKEALAAAHVIKFLFLKMALMEVVLDVGYSAASFLAAIASGPSKGERLAVIFTLTEGTLTNAEQMVRGVLLRRHRRAHFTLVVVGDSFVFPSHDFYNDLSKTGGSFGPTAAADLREAAGENVSPEDVANTLQSIFASLAIVANVPGASEAMLKQSINTMILRIAFEGAREDTTEEHKAVVQQAAPAAPDAPEPKAPASTSAPSAAAPAEDPADSADDDCSSLASRSA